MQETDSVSWAMILLSCFSIELTITKMKKYLLIHGSWHGAWCWYKVAPQLISLGHQVTMPDLPGRISNPQRPIFVGLKDMLNALAIELPVDQKTTIVVHSRYGILASQLAEIYPDRIEAIIYLASFMIGTEKSASEYFKMDKNSVITPYIEISKVGMWDRLGSEIYREGLYHDCSDEDNRLGLSLLGKEPLRPAVTKLKLSDERYGRVQKSYIRLTDDRAVSISLQDKLLNETDVDRVESIPASHSAYFSKPTELVEKIASLSRP